MARGYKAQVLRLDPGAKSSLEPHKWPGTPPGRMGSRWFVRDSNGEEIGRGDVGNANSAWRRAYSTLMDRNR